MSDKVTHVIDFTAEPVVQFDVQVVKNTFVDDGDMQLIANKLWYEYLKGKSIRDSTFLKLEHLKSGTWSWIYWPKND